MPRSIYTKLTGRHRTLLGYTQLWLAPDHLLLLKSSRIAENYQRFSFSDIQSIVVTELPSRAIVQAIMILWALAWMSLAFAFDSKFAKWGFGASGALGLVMAILDVARGPRCRAVLYTRVTKEPLAPVSRTGIARKFLAGIRPRIEAAQGVLPVDAQTPVPAWEPPPPEIARPPGYLPEIVCGLFLVNAVLLWAGLQFPKAAEIQSVLVNTMMAEVLLTVVALIRRKGRDERLVVYAVLVVALLGIGYDAFIILRSAGGWYMTVLEKARHNDRSVTPILLFARGGLSEKIASGWRAAAGVIGLAAAFWERRK